MTVRNYLFSTVSYRTTKKDKLTKEMNNQVVKDFLATFPDAKLVDVTEDNDD